MKHSFFGILIFLTLFPLSVGAFSISPLSFKTNIDAGKSGVVWVEVVNDEDVDQIYQVGVLGARQNNLGQPVFKSNTDLAEGWVVPEDKEIVVKSRNVEKMVFNIQVPKNAPPGSHYLGLFVEPKIDTAQLGIKSRLLTLLSIQVSGVAFEKLNIKKWIGAKNVLFSNDLNFDLDIRNEGNVSVPLKITVYLYNSKGVAVEQREIKTGADLMAGLDRNYKIDFSELKMKPGRYKAKVHTEYGLTKQSIVEVKEFWFFPRNTIFYLSTLIFAVFLFLSALYFLNKKSYAKGK